MNNITEIKKSRVILTGLNTTSSIDEFEHSMDELSALASACDFEVVGIHTQNLPSPNNAFYVGTGKVEEIAQSVAALEADYVIFNESLSPIQLRNLADALKCGVLDRTTLILQIFSSRARTKEAMLQVELANLQYMLPRLVGLHAALSRQGGGSGSLSNKGSGEKKLELDRRHIEQRITELKKDLNDVSRERATTRKQRESSGMKKIALVGYTNAGKSTIMNWFIDTYGGDESKKVLEKDMLFATLDTTIRKITPPQNVLPPFLLSDTVGFIDKLPHTLVKAFHSTLEEVTFADLILHVIDASDEHADSQLKVTEKTLEELSAGTIPVIYIFNKAEKKQEISKLPVVKDNKIYLSAKSRIGMEELLTLISEKLHPSRKTVTFLFPHSRGDLLNHLFQYATVLEYSYTDDGILCRCTCDERERQKFKQYIVIKE